MEKPKVNLMILTPGHSLIGSYVKSLLATTKELDRLGITWGYSNEFASHVADAREVTLSGTFDNDIANNLPFGGNLEYDKLLWIDSDISWQPEDVLKLYYSDKDIVSGAYLLSNGSVMWQKKLLGQFYSYSEVMDIDNEEEFEIDAAGFGFICIKKGVFESLSRPWFQSANKSIEVDGVTYNFNVIGEDISLCSRAKDVGFKIYAHPGVKVIHQKTVKLTWEGIKQ